MGGTGLDMLNFRCLGLLKGWHSEMIEPSDVIKSKANKKQLTKLLWHNLTAL